MANKEKIQVKDQWAEKYLREALWMPFGSMCNFLGQAFQGKGIEDADFERLAKKVFELASAFTEQAYEKITRLEEEPEIPVKK